MVLTKMSNLFCLICGTVINDSSYVNIYTSLLRNGESLENFALRVLRPVLLELQSSYVCSQCHSLFRMLEQAQRTVTNIRCEIWKLYQRGRKEKLVKQVSQDREHNLLADDYGEQGKEVVDHSANQIKSTVTLPKPINSRINVTSQTPWQNTILNQGLGILDVDTITDVNNTKVTKTSTGKKKLGCSNKEYISHAVLSNAKSTNSNSSIINVDVTRVEEYLKQPSTLNTNISNNPLSNPTMLRRDHDVNDNNTEQRKASYTQQCKYCVELFKSYNELRIHMLKHENLQEYQDLEKKMEFFGTSQKHEANNCIDAVMYRTIIKDSSLSQDNQAQEQDFLETHKIHTSIVEAEKHGGNSSGNGDHSSTNVNHQIESNSPSVSWISDKASKSKLSEYSCGTCRKKWKTSAELRAHAKTHSTLRPYMCEKCGQAYKHKHALEVHIGMHNGINPFQCNYCKKCFTQKGALMRHLPMHTGETPYQCELCGKRFVHHTSYNMHTLSHTGKKSYQCNICDMFLLSTSHLKRHMRVHTGEKPYSCNLCGKRFAERYNLYAHRKIHDPVEITMKEKRKVQRKCEQRNLISDKEQELNIHSKHNGNSDKKEEKRLTDSIFNIDGNAAKGSDHTLCTQDINIKATNFRDNTNGETWIESASAKLHVIEDRTKLILLENCLPQIDTSSFITFNDQHFSMQNINHDISSQIDVTLNTGPNTSHIIIEKINS